MHSKTDNIKTLINNEADELIIDIKVIWNQ